MGDLLLGNRIGAKTAGVNAELAAPEGPGEPDVDLGAREPGVLRRDMGLVFDRESFRQSGPVELP